MRSILSLTLLFSLCIFAYAQKPTPRATPKKTPVKTSNESADIEKIDQITEPEKKIEALNKFIAKYPKSKNIPRVSEMLVAETAQVAEEKFRIGDTAAAVELFRKAINAAPEKPTDKLFFNVLVKIPESLFYREQPVAGVETARALEEKIKTSAKHLIGLADFYIATENGADALRVLDAAIVINPALPEIYRRRGLANRVAFDLKAAEADLTKALEFDKDHVQTKRDLAGILLANGKFEAAETIYRELFTADAKDFTAQNGVVLTLFESGKIQEGEAELQKALEARPTNFQLMTAVAYHFAAIGNAARATELAERSLAIEGRYVWSYIALARAQIRSGNALDAEKTLILAKRFGNFPTLNYEIASARYAAGFYRDAANVLKDNFALAEDNLTVKLGGKIETAKPDFVELLSPERRASTFNFLSADDPLSSKRLRALLEFHRALDTENPTSESVIAAAKKFTEGDDQMQLYRELYVARCMLEKNLAPTEATSILQNAVKHVDSALTVQRPESAVMADELFEPRRLAESRGEVLLVPTVPKNTLRQIIRGSIEHLSGWAFLQQNNPKDATLRFKRALVVLPEKSAWWRAAMWRLSTAQQAEGKDKDALDTMIKVYTADAPDYTRRLLVENLYKKINGSLVGLDEKIGARPAGMEIPAETLAAQPTPTPTPETTATETPVPTPTPEAPKEVVAEPTPTPEIQKSEETSQTTPDTNPKTESAFPKLAPEILKTESADQTKPSETPKPENSFPKLAPEVLITDPLAPKPTSEVQTKATETQTQAKTVQIDDLTSKTSTETKNTEGGSVQTDAPANKTSTPTTQIDSKSVQIDDPTKNIKTEGTQTEDNLKQTSTESVQIKTTETNTEANTTQKPAEETQNKRPRVIPTTRARIAEGTQPESESKCEIITPQNSLTVMSKGIAVGMVVRIVGADPTTLEVTTDAPDDIQIQFDKELGNGGDRLFYSFSSKSDRTGDFKVIFKLGCTQKEIAVRVR